MIGGAFAHSHRPSGRAGALGQLLRAIEDDSGATAVEFGALAAAFIGMMFLVFQVGLYLYFSASLTYATNAAARQIMIGTVGATSGMNAAMFQNQFLCPKLPGAMNCSNIIVNAFSVPANGSFAGQPAPAMDNSKTNFCIGTAGSYVVLQVYYAMPVMGFSFFPTPTTNFNGQPSIFINANSVFLNEPSATSNTAC